MRNTETTRGCTGWRILAIWFVLVSLGVAGEPPKPKAVEKAANCELILEGKQIEKLVLEDEQGVSKRFVSPGARVLLPAGKYSVREVELKGGYSAPAYRFYGESERLVLAPDKPCVPEFGAPLKQTIKAERTGRLLELSYQLQDAGGHAYTPNNRENPPQFAIYQGDALLGSGTFEYG